MWHFVSPQITFGDAALHALDELQGTRALVVTDPTLVELGLVERVTSRLHAASIDSHIFDAVGLCLPYSLEYAAPDAPQRGAELARRLGFAQEGGEAGARELAARVRDLIQEIGNPVSVAELGIERAAYTALLENLVDDTFSDTQVVTAPRSPSYDDLRELFLHAYTGEPVEF